MAVGIGGRRLVRRRPRTSAAVAVLLVITVVVGMAAGVLPGPRRFVRSFGVRVGYWRTGLAIARERPLLGAGPGCWPEWYAMYKQPEFEETQAAHSAYVQTLAETGAAGLLAWVMFLAAVVRAARRRGPEAEQRDPPPEADGMRGVLAMAAPVVVAVILLGDYVLMGTFVPPPYVPDWLEAAPWLPTLLVCAVWAAAFLALFGARGGVGARVPAWALWGGVAGFLFHSAGEFTLRVPALGTAAAVLCTLLLARPECRGVRLRPMAGGLLLATAAGVVVFWMAVPLPRAVEAAISAAEARQSRDMLLGGAGRRLLPREMRAHVTRATDAYRRACAAMPWDDRAWHARAEWALGLAAGTGDPGYLAEASEAAQRAVDANPLSSTNWALLGQVREAAGDAQEAASAYERAAELHPSLPKAWYRYGRAAERAGADAMEVLTAYQRAQGLMSGQYHERNRVLGTEREFRAFWREVRGTEPPAEIPHAASDLAEAGRLWQQLLEEKVASLGASQSAVSPPP